MEDTGSKISMPTKLSTLPGKPGVYIFKNARERPLYVGKAKNLRNRLRSYFHKSSGLDARKTSMMREVRDFSYIVTGNELEAFVLEANLIKQYKPRFNVILKDDKNYPYLKLTVNEDWPRLEVVRRITKDGALYFGPYVPAGTMWETLDFIRRNFRIRDCSYTFGKKIRPCIQYQMGRCLAPCDGHITREEYLKLIDEIKQFLSGKKRDLTAKLEKRMLGLSGELKFEEAAGIRDRIKAIEKAWESQKVVDPALGDIDIIGFYKELDEVSFKVFFIRNGVMIGLKDFFIRDTEDVSDKELFHAFIAQFYAKEIIPPAEVVSAVMPEEARSLKIWLGDRKDGAVKISTPKSGKKKELVDMASENARLTFKSQRDVKTDEILREIQERFGLEKVPKSAGALDVSNISGEMAVGAFVYWAGGMFRKDMYRRLKIKTVKGIDDYSMMAEIVGRTINNLKDKLPDIIIIDGGKGHLETARKIFKKNMAVLSSLPTLIAVAKDPDRAYMTTSAEPSDLEDRRLSSLFLQRMRDEAHRFAVGYHRKLRTKGMLRSPLENISGIGRKRRLELLRVFGSIEDIRNSTVDEIRKIRGFNKKAAEELLDVLRKTS
jgi:excinuclease ABC subunit C